MNIRLVGYLHILLTVVTCFTNDVLCCKFKFKVKPIQQKKEITMAIFVAPLYFTMPKAIINNYYKPLRRELINQDMFANVNLYLDILISSETILHIDDIVEADLFSLQQYSILNWELRSKTNTAFSKRFSNFLEDYGNDNDDNAVLVLIVSHLPATCLQQLIRIKHDTGVGIIIIFLVQYSSFETHIPYKHFPMSFYLHDDDPTNKRGLMFNLLKEGVTNPYFDRFEALRSVVSMRNTSCVSGVELVWIFNFYLSPFGFEDQFVQLLVRMEKLLVLDNNQEVAFKIVVIHNEVMIQNEMERGKYIHYDYGMKLQPPRFNYGSYKRFFQEPISQDRKNNKVFLNIYFERDTIANGIMNDRGLQYISMPVYYLSNEQPRIENNRIHVNHKDIASDEVVDLILEALIDIACL